MSNKQTMVKRVEKAIRKWDLDLHPARAERMARAAIEAMREPSDEMIRAIAAKLNTLEGREVLSVWSAAISAALTEKEDG